MSFISPVDMNGLENRTEVRGSLSYIYGLADFWTTIFADKDLVDSLLEVSTLQLGEAYGQFLQRAGNISLKTIQDTYNTQIKLMLFGQADLVDQLSGTTYKLPEKIQGIKYMMNRPMLPTQSLIEGVHFEINEDFDEITFYKPLSALGFPRRVTSDGVEQYALWASNVEIDEGIIFAQYGQCVGMTKERAIGNYKDFVDGLYFLYSHGPIIDYTIAGVNLALGIPTARSTESVLSVLQNPITGHWEVLTAQNFYDIPYGFRPDIAVGDQLTEGQQLTSWVNVKDYQKDGKWWYNTFIPKELTGGVQYPAVTPNTDMDWLMSTYLKFNTFMVLFQEAGISLAGYYTVSEVIFRARPSHTYPIFVWAAPMGDEIINIIDDDLTIGQLVEIEDTIYEGRIIDFVRGDRSTIFDRGTNYYNRYQTPKLMQQMVGDFPKDGEFRGINADGRPLSGIGGWVDEANEGIQEDIYRMDPLMASRGTNVVVRTRSTGMRSYRGSELATSEGGTRTYLNQDGLPITLDTRNIVPLYLCHVDELKAKLVKINRQATAALLVKGTLPIWVDNLTAATVYSDIILRDTTDTAEDYDPNLEKVFTFKYSENYVPPILSRHQGMMYVPKLADLPGTLKLLLCEIYMDCWSVSLIVETTTIMPTYFPVDDGDPIEMTMDFEERPGSSPITRETYLANPAIVDARSVQDGHYQDGRGGTMLNFNRGGNFGGDLKAYIRRD
jgi:hypothetical protein